MDNEYTPSERLVRVETKLDVLIETLERRDAAQTKRDEKTDERLKELESFKVRTMAFVGGAWFVIVTLAGVVGWLLNR